MSETVTLLPCPCCGGEARLAQVAAGGLEWAQVECMNADDCGLIGPTHGSEPGAVERWNTRTALSAMPRPDDAQDDERFLTAYVSRDGRVVGIDHPTDASWHDVLQAHEALLARVQERIAEQQNCPFYVALRPDDALREAGAEIARLRGALRPTLFWDDNDPETGYSNPWEVVEQSPMGEIVAVRLGTTLGVRYFASLPAADDAESDDDWEAESDDAEVVESLVKAELARRAALANGEGR